MIVEGKKIADEILARIKAEISQMPSAPLLGVVLVGNDQSSVNYVERKKRAGEHIGLGVNVFHLSENIREGDLLVEIKRIQAEEGVSGLIIQLPLPEGINTELILEAIEPEKDVDCLTKANLSGISAKNFNLLPPTPGAVLEILHYYNVDLTGKKIVLVGRGQLVGAPMALILQAQGYDFDICTDVASSVELLRSADVIITGVGKPKIITAEMVKDGAIVIDTGISFVEGKVVGDIDFESLKDKASLITPPVGGVGPVTVAKLLENVARTRNQ